MHVAVVLSHWHLGERIGYYIRAEFGLGGTNYLDLLQNTQYLCYCSLLLVTLPFPLPWVGVGTAARRHHPSPAGRFDQSDVGSVLIYPPKQHKCSIMGFFLAAAAAGGERRGRRGGGRGGGGRGGGRGGLRVHHLTE